jgi:ribonuclease HI
MEYVDIWADGACIPNPGEGGYGVVLTSKNRRRELSGYDPQSTNIRMEMKAAIRGLQALKKPCKVTVYTDSELVVRTMEESWKRRANRDLWAELDAACKPHKVRFVWVKGHNGNPYNEMCDKLAKNAIRTKGNGSYDR